MNSTEMQPYIEANESSLIIDFDRAPMPASNEFPGLVKPGMDDQELEDCLVMASEYMASYVNVSDDHLTRTVKGVTNLQVLEAWGAIIVFKEGKQFTNSRTGESAQAYGVVFKLREENGEFTYLGFTSVSALTFLRRFVMPLPGIRGQLGDWTRSIRFSVKAVPAATGHTFSFKLIRGLQS